MVAAAAEGHPEHHLEGAEAEEAVGVPMGPPCPEPVAVAVAEEQRLVRQGWVQGQAQAAQVLLLQELQELEEAEAPLRSGAEEAPWAR